MQSNPLFRCSDIGSLLGYDEYRTKEDVLKNVIYRRHQASIGREYKDKVKDLDEKIDKSEALSKLVQMDMWNPQQIEETLPTEERELIDRVIARNAMEIGKKTEQVIIKEKAMSTDPEKKYLKNRYYTLYGIADALRFTPDGVEEVIEIKTRMSNFHLTKEVPMKFWIQLICYIILYNAKKGVLIERFPNGQERRSELTRIEANDLWDIIHSDLNKIAQEVLSKTQEEIDLLCADLS